MLRRLHVRLYRLDESIDAQSVESASHEKERMYGKVEGLVDVNPKNILEQESQNKHEEKPATYYAGYPDVSQVLEIVSSHHIDEVLHSPNANGAHDSDSENVGDQNEDVCQ